MSPSVTIGPFVVGEKPAPLVYTFQDSTGAAIDLSGYAVRYVYRERDGTAATRNGTLVSGPQGQVSYTWDGTEFPTPGHYLSEFWVGNLTQRWCSVRLEFDVRSPVGPVPAI